ncbi:MAG: response regulator [Pseudomonadota bacterium]|nr:response regulator [Pseudomonadota bacterium]
MKETKKYIGSNKPYLNGPKVTIFYFALAVLSIFLGLAFFQYQTLFLALTILSALGIVFIFEQLFKDNSGTDQKNSTIDLEIDQKSYQNQKIQSIGQLAGGVAHDFNNVLTAIIVSTDLLILRFKPEDPTFRELQEIRENAQRAAGIVRQLLAYSRQQNFNLEIISLTDLLQEQTILLNRLVGDKIKIDLKHDSKLWNIRADLNQFESVITNLVINARDAIEVNGKDGVITIQTDNILNVDIPRHYAVNLEDRDYVRVTVTDNGAGVPSEMKDKIFEPFYSSKGVQGTGLGLSMVYGIIKQLNGYIFLTNTETGEGARFEIYIPRCIEVNVRETNDTAIINKKNTKDITGSGAILLVEDEDSVRTFTKKALELSGYNITEAYDGVSALRYLNEEKNNYDLVITDVMMPEMDGPTLASEIKKNNPQQKILFISGYTENHENLISIEEKEVYFLNKPFTLEELNLTVKKVIQS